MTRQSINLTEKIEFHELMFHIQILRLNRPSPRCPNPTREMRKKALKSAIALIKEFSVIDQLRKLFYLWHAAYCIVESGICLLASVLIGMESTGQDLTHLEGEDVTILMRYIKTFPFLLWKVSRRWSNIAQHAVTLEAIALSVLGVLQRWSSGETIKCSDIYALKEELSQFSLCSPFPLRAPPAADDRLEPMGNELYLASEATAAPMAAYPTIDPSDFQVSATEAASFDSSWEGPQSALEHSSLMFPDPVSIDSGDAFAWDFAGINSEEIFAALLEAGEIDS